MITYGNKSTIKNAFLVAFICSAIPFNSSHSAVHLSTTETGSAIIVPFYTVSNQMNTLLSLNNTTGDNKAVKIHFKEAKNGDLLASFNVYLTGYDMWTMGMGQVPSINGARMRMVSNDESCTVGFPNNQDIAMSNDWLWENGIIEIIEMGTVDPTEAPLVHRNCELIDQMWQTDQVWANNNEDQMSAASGGLHAEVTLMDIEQGHSANIPIIHMNNFLGNDNIQHTAAGEPTPNLSSGSKESLVMIDGQAIATTWPTGYEAVSALLMHNTLRNEYNLDPIVAAKTDWIVSFPTMSYHLSNPNTIKPFRSNNMNDVWFPYFYSHNISIFNRSGFETYFSCGLGTCPPIPTDTVQHTVVNFVTQAAENYYQHPINPLLTNASANNTQIIVVPNGYSGYSHEFENGTIRITLDPNHGYTVANDRGTESSDSNIRHEYYGLPVVGFTYSSFTNAAAQPGLLAQYAFLREHFGHQKVIVNPE